MAFLWNFLDYKKKKNLCNSVKKYSKKSYLHKARENRIMGSKKFWSTVKPRRSKCFLHNDNTSIELDNKIIAGEFELAKKLNSQYINVVKSRSNKIINSACRISKIDIDATFIDRFKNHWRIISIKNEFLPIAELNIKTTTVNQIYKITGSLDAKKATDAQFQCRL